MLCPDPVSSPQESSLSPLIPVKRYNSEIKPPPTTGDRSYGLNRAEGSKSKVSQRVSSQFKSLIPFLNLGDRSIKSGVRKLRFTAQFTLVQARSRCTKFCKSKVSQRVSSKSKSLIPTWKLGGRSLISGVWKLRSRA